MARSAVMEAVVLPVPLWLKLSASVTSLPPVRVTVLEVPFQLTVLPMSCPMARMGR